MRLRSTLLMLSVALLAGAAGLILSLRLNGPGPLLGTAAGRWLVEHVVPSRVPTGIIPASEGDMIGLLALSDLDGKMQQFHAKGGHRVLINVWASWCGPCRDEMPLLAAFAKDQGSNSIQVIGIAQDDPAAVRSYLLQTPVNYPILLDDAQGHAGARLGNRLGVLPYSALLDANGRLLRSKYGPFASVKALSDWVSAP